MRIRIENARIVDGTGAPAYDGAVTIEDEHLAEVGEASAPPDEVLDARGRIVAPGFIDVHSHSDFTLPGQPEAEAKIAQGVTTEVVCNCGLGLLPSNERVERFYSLIQPIVFGEPGGRCYATLDAYRAALEGRGVSVNVACLVPHGNVRAAVMGLEERAATATEIGHMQALVTEGMEHGAFGLSTGLVYPPGAFAQRDEITEIVRPIRPFGGFYATHMRDEGTRVVESVEEALAIGRAAGVGVQISHHKAAGRLNWGKTKKTLALLDAARAEGLDVHSDVYPYTAGSTVLSAMVVPLWAFQGSQAQLLERLKDPPTRARIIRESKERLVRLAPLPTVVERLVPKPLLVRALLRAMSKLVVISSTKRQHHYEGKTLDEMARMRGQDLFEAILDLLVEEETAVAAIAHVMGERDVRRVMAHPQTMIGTDGFPQREGKPHPRTYGTYPRVLERYVRELGVLTLEQAVHKSTGMVAAKLGLTDRGVLRPGARADVVVFDFAGLRDRATYEDPRHGPEGLDHVFVNGAWTWRDGAHTGARAGRVLAKRAAA